MIVVNLCMLTANIFVKLLQNSDQRNSTVVCYIGTMFMQIEQGAKYPDAGL